MSLNNNSADQGGALRVIGLAGGVGAGKSTVARMFEDLGCARFDADAHARATLDAPDVRSAIVEEWGAGVLGGDGAIDRAALGRVVFADPVARTRLESLVHPHVRRAMRDAIESARAAGKPAIVLDIPLLVEGGLDELCDAVIFVDAPEARRDDNVRERGWNAEERAKREHAQSSLAKKRDRADLVIANDAGLDRLREQVGDAFARILGGAGRMGHETGRKPRT